MMKDKQNVNNNTGKGMHVKMSRKCRQSTNRGQKK